MLINAMIRKIDKSHVDGVMSTRESP